MKNKELSQFLQYQIDKKKKKISENNSENVDLRIECQHLESAIKIINESTQEEIEDTNP